MCTLVHVSNATVHVSNVMVSQLFVLVVYQMLRTLNISTILLAIQCVQMAPILMASTVPSVMLLLSVRLVQFLLRIALLVPETLF